MDVLGADRYVALGIVALVVTADDAAGNQAGRTINVEVDNEVPAPIFASGLTNVHGAAATTGFLVTPLPGDDGSAGSSSTPAPGCSAPPPRRAGGPVRPHHVGRHPREQERPGRHSPDARWRVPHLRGVFDLAGNATSVRRTVIVDNHAPTVSFGTTPSNSTKITAKATDPYGVSRVQLLINGKVVATDSTAPYTRSPSTARSTARPSPSSYAPTTEPAT